MARTRFRASVLGSTSVESVVNPREDGLYLTFYAEPGVAGTLIYQGERLHQVFVAMKLPSEGTGDWSIAIENERKQKHDAWLRDELGAPPYRFPWGSVESNYDAKGCASDIIVTYAG